MWILTGAASTKCSSEIRAASLCLSRTKFNAAFFSFLLWNFCCSTFFKGNTTPRTKQGFSHSLSLAGFHGTQVTSRYVRVDDSRGTDESILCHRQNKSFQRCSVICHQLFHFMLLHQQMLTHSHSNHLCQDSSCLISDAIHGIKHCSSTGEFFVIFAQVFRQHFRIGHCERHKPLLRQ